MTHPTEMVPVLPWPFRDGRFPRHLGAVVINTVLNGKMPALQVVHFPGGEWGISDGVNQPDERNCTATHIWHVLERDESLHRLASLAPGFQADRDEPGGEWTISPFEPGEPYRLKDRVLFSFNIIRFGVDEAEKQRAERFHRSTRINLEVPPED
jgi:hypothetical protein